MTIPSKVAPALRDATHLAQTWLAPLADLLTRLVLFRVFFYSGLTKIANWEGTLQLFEYEYAVPLLPPAIAAYLATATELTCPVLLVAGLAARLAALPLLATTMVIQFVLGAVNPAYDDMAHFLWMALLLGIVARGPGALSLDRLIARRFGIA